MKAQVNHRLIVSHSVGSVVWRQAVVMWIVGDKSPLRRINRGLHISSHVLANDCHFDKHSYCRISSKSGKSFD